MPDQTPKISLQLIATLHFPGYLSCMRQASLLAHLNMAQPLSSSASEETLDRRLSSILANYQGDIPPSGHRVHSLGIRVARIVSLVLKQAGFPIFEKEDYVVLSDPESEVFRVVLPCFDQGSPVTKWVLDWTLELFEALLQGQSADPWKTRLEELYKKIGRYAPQGVNSLRFIEAANELDIPWRPVAANVVQFGHGCKARWLDSSFTDVTPNISARLSRNKIDTAKVLRRAGVPVQPHRLVRNGEEAVQAAGELGYPVVIKPADLDGGQGVAPGLRTPDKVRKAFDKAKALSSNVLLEKHFEGNDYRLQVFADKVYWVVHRVPGSVTGDGIHTIGELLARLNADPRRNGSGHKIRWKQIPLDEEALELLIEQGLKPDTVPLQGQFVRLRQAANVASGGEPVPVVLEHAHPDNLALAVRAARILRLDIAGVDLLIPDISRSWLDTGCAICEVNGQPQLSPHLPLHLLRQLVEGDGRIPIIMIIGQTDHMPWLELLKKELSPPGINLGISEPQGIWIGETKAGTARLDAYHAASALIVDNSVQRILIVVEDSTTFRSGFPADRIDVLIVAGALRNGSEEKDMETTAQLAGDAAKITRHVVVMEDSEDALKISKELVHQSVTVCPAPVMPETLAKLI